MTEPRRTTFLERSSYRRRRARDASRMLPLLGLLLFFLPGIWPKNDVGEIQLSSALIFLFVAWCGVIVISAFLSRHLSEPVVGSDDKTDD